MQLNCDSYFQIGRKHLGAGNPCQDYSLVGTKTDGMFAIVSDGCSSGGKTDIGSRLLCLTTAKALRKKGGVNPPNQRVILETSEELGLEQEDLLATLGYIDVSPEGATSYLFGDGVIACKLHNDFIFMSRFDWEQNTPLYPAYANDNFLSFIQAHGGNINARVLIEEKRILSPEGVTIKKERIERTLAEGMQGVQKKWSQRNLERNIAFLAIFSDGVTQIDNYDWADAVRELMSFKNTAGEFAKRRMIRFLKNTEKQGKGPMDDIAYAVIHAQPQKGG